MILHRMRSNRRVNLTPAFISSQFWLRSGDIRLAKNMATRKLVWIFIRPARDNSVCQGLLMPGNVSSRFFDAWLMLSGPLVFRPSTIPCATAFVSRAAAAVALAVCWRIWSGLGMEGSTTANRDQTECRNDDPFHPDLDATRCPADVCRQHFFPLASKPPPPHIP